MKTLREALERAQRDGHAPGHFNVSDLVALRAIAEVGRELGTAVRRAVEAIRAIGTGVVVEGEIGWIGAAPEIHAEAGVPR